MADSQAIVSILEFLIPQSVAMSDFDQLVDSRKQWIADVLVPWCRLASLKQLVRAEREWMDIAGKVDPQRTLWLWAWGRFPGLVSEGLNGVEETYRVLVTLRDGSQQAGYPDARRTERGRLVLLGDDGESDPLSLDDIQSVERID